MKTCAVIGAEFTVDTAYDQYLRQRLARFLDDFHIQRILASVSTSSERAAAEHFLTLSEYDPHLWIDVVLMAEGEADDWSEEERDRFFRIMARCDREIILHNLGPANDRFARNLLMIDHSDLVLVLGEDEEALFWSARKQRPCVQVKTSPPAMVPDLALAVPPPCDSHYD